MQVKTMAEIIDVFIVFPFLFAASGKHNIQPNYLLMAGALALIAIVFRWYKNLKFNDRFLLAFQGFILTLIVIDYSPLSISVEGSADSTFFTAEQLYHMLFYTILIIIGTYTTFCTPPGFTGVESDDKNKISRASLKLFVVVIAMGLWCLYFSQYDDQPLLYEWGFPLTIIRIAYDTLGDQVRGKKSRSKKSKISWAFKWKY